MADFLHSLPEEEGFTTLQNLRRPQLLQLAKAFGVQHPPNCIKKKLLPLLETTIHVTAGGRIQAIDGSEPVNAEYLLPAGLRPDRVAAREAAKKVRKKKKVETVSEEITMFASGGLVYKWRGGAKWCVMNGDEVVQSGLNKEDAIAACG